LLARFHLFLLSTTIDLLPIRNDRLPGKPARPDGIAAGPDGPAYGQRLGMPAAGRKASGGPQAWAAGGAAMAKLGPDVVLKSWLPNTSIFRNHRPASSSLARISVDETARLR